jgi:hypothetical protein
VLSLDGVAIMLNFYSLLLSDFVTFIPSYQLHGAYYILKLSRNEFHLRESVVTQAVNLTKLFGILMSQYWQI